MNREVHMQAIRRSVSGCAAALTLASCLVAAAPASADTQPLHLGITTLQFTSFACVNNACSLADATTTGKATSNLATGVGDEQGTLILDFSPGGSCNIVDETEAFVFDSGTILLHSHHEDCAIHGLRIDTTFAVTGGTGAFIGASGSGREFTSAAAPPAVLFNGTISF
jgi:hypothetical protein